MATQNQAAAGKTRASRAKKADQAKEIPAPLLSTTTDVGPAGAPLEKPAESHDVTDEQRAAEQAQAQANAIAQFTPNEMTTPAAHEPATVDPEEAKKAALMVAIAQLAKDMGLNPSTVLNMPQAAQPKPGRPEKQVQNNITRPGAGTKCAVIWDLADKLSAEAGGVPVPVATLRQHPDMKQVNDATLKTQFARWRGYHGIKGRAPVVQNQRPSPEGRDEGIEKAWGRRAEDADRRKQ